MGDKSSSLTFDQVVDIIREYRHGVVVARDGVERRRFASVMIVMAPAESSPLFVDARILFTKRSMRMRRSPGEVAFPGGKVEEGESFMETAMRETEEEVGLSARDIQVIGEIDPIITFDDLTVFAFVAVPRYYLAKPPRSQHQQHQQHPQQHHNQHPRPSLEPATFGSLLLSIKPSEEEVESVFFAPVSFFLSATHHRSRETEYVHSTRRLLHYFDYRSEENGEEYTVWGLTAWVLLRLVEILDLPTEYSIHPLPPAQTWMMHSKALHTSSSSSSSSSSESQPSRL